MKISIPNINIVSLFLVAYVFLILYMPNSILFPTTIYFSGTPGYIQQTVLSYSYSYLEIPLFLIAILVYKRSKSINFMPIIVLVTIQNLIRFIFGFSNPIVLHSYEMFLCLISGYCSCIIISAVFNNISRMEKVLDIIILVNFITQLIVAITGKVQYGGRYAVLGQDVGSVGLFSVTYILINLFVREKIGRSTAILMTVAIASMLLAGSRTHLLMLIFILALFIGRFIKRTVKTKNLIKSIFIIATLGIAGISVLINKTNIFDSSHTGYTESALTRFVNLFSSSNSINNSISSDESFTSRIESIAAGLELIKNNMLGISNSFIDLQIRTILEGYPTFPHSFLISYYLLYGISALICYIIIISWTIKSIRVKSSTIVLLVFFLILFLIWGGPILRVKEYFWYFIIFSYIKLNLEKDIKTNLIRVI
jgi:hypothetical protein